MTATELLTRRALTFQPSTYDAERGTVDVTFSTGSDVMRADYEGQYVERLAMGPENVNLASLAGAPVLDNHDRQSGIGAILGVVVAARVEGGIGVATIQFSKSQRGQELAADVQAGVIRNVSAGYSVEAWAVSKRADGMRIKTATRWTPKEISFTAIGADPGATVRTLPKENHMDRNESIRTLAGTLGVSSTFTDGLIQRSDLTIEQARAEMIHEAARLLPTITNRQPARVTPVASTADLTRGAAEALYTRIKPGAEVSEIGRQFVGRRMADMARFLLAERGDNAMGSDAEIIDRSLHTTSDFSNLLSNLANKTLQASYQTAPSGMKTVAKASTATDFKAKLLLRRGEMPTLEKVNEKGEFKRGSMVEGKESYSVDTFGRVFGVTRKTIINDDLDAFGDITAGWGLAASEFENGYLVDVLVQNSGGGPKLADTVNLFHASHGNLASPGVVIGESSISAARLAMRLQKGLNGTQAINVTPKYLLAPAALETAAEKFLATLYATQTSNVNPFSGKLELIIDPRLDAKSVTRWYIFADPSVLPVIEYAYLQGYEGVQVETRNGFDVDGVEVRARLDFGAGGVDFRGAYMNPGA